MLQGDYKKEHEETKDKNRFDVTSTPVYEHQKSVEKATGEVRDLLIFNRLEIKNDNINRWFLLQTLETCLHLLVMLEFKLHRLYKSYKIFLLIYRLVTSKILRRARERCWVQM